MKREFTPGEVAELERLQAEALWLRRQHDAILDRVLAVLGVEDDRSWAFDVALEFVNDADVPAAALAAALARDAADPSTVPAIPPGGPDTRGRRLRLAREARGLSQRQLAIAVGCQQPVISSYERDICRPPPARHAALARVVGVPAAWLSAVE